jgi:hypothetical protein
VTSSVSEEHPASVFMVYMAYMKEKMFPQFLKLYLLAYMQITSNRTTNLKYFPQDICTFLSNVKRENNKLGKGITREKFWE